jgi:prepilin-type N-terminal cleavage/methylation domain-containing protein
VSHGQGAVARRGAFTIIELMIVVVIIGILVGLTAPALMRAFGTARDSQVRVEISQLENAINAFKTTYGTEPPSRIVLCEAAADWDPATTTYRLTGDTSPFAKSKAQISQSRAVIRRIWPQFDFGAARDLNSDGDSTDAPVVLNASQCLVFFLGGGRDAAGGLIGFAKNPTNPFATGGGREGPFFEFRLERVVSASAGLYPGYLDLYPGQIRPYLYFSSYDGRGYQPLGADGRPGRAGVDDDGNGSTDFLDSPTNTIFDPLEVGFAGSDDESPPGGPSSVYLAAVSGTSSTPHKQTSFQIISPGNDQKYGTGGLFEATKQKVSLATRRPTSGAGLDSDIFSGAAEHDNITNIHGGRLFSK